MPRSRKLTWQAGTNGRTGRWRKKYRGRSYYFSGGRGKTDQVAYENAVQAWEKKKLEVDATTPKRHQADYDAAINEWQYVLSWCRKHSDDEMAAVAATKLEKLQTQLASPRPAAIAREDKLDGQFDMSVRNPTLQQMLDDIAENFEPLPVSVAEVQAGLADLETRLAEQQGPLPMLTPNPDSLWPADPLQIEKAVWSDRLNVLHRSDEPHEADLQSHIDRFLAAKRATVSAGRADMLRLLLNRFSQWCGSGTNVTELAGKTLAEYHQDLMEQARAKSLASATAKECLSSVKTFIRWLWQRDVIPSLPRIMDGRTQQLNIPVDNNEIVVFTIAEIKSLLAKASQRTKLYILLMLNCGMTQKDIADLLHSEVDWKTKQIIRRRSKTKSHVTVPIVRYRLWEETFALLLAERSNGNEEKVLLNTNGKPLWQETVDEGGKYAKIDNIKSAYSRLCKQAATSKPLKSLKKTSATGCNPILMT
jgi:site-specific recombinase XerD